MMTTRLGIAAVLALLLTCAGGCSLLTIKSPEKPLSPRDLNARILTHELAARFNVSVEAAADEIAAGTADGVVRENALKWKIGASTASDKAASQIVPVLGLLDMWALTVQMRDYLTAGNGKALFGSQQPHAVSASAQLAGEAEALARGVTDSAEFSRDQSFVADYARDHPIDDLKFARASLVEYWQQQNGGNAKLVDSLGTVPEALAETSDLLRLYGDTMPSQALWRAELAVQQSGVSSTDVQGALKRLDDRMAHLTTLADSTPDLVHDVVRDVRKQVDVSVTDVLEKLHAERVDLSASISVERQAAVDAFASERAAISAEAARIASQTIRDAGEQARRLVRDTLLLLIALAVVILGLPFTAGYLVGRARHRVG
ncbi:MAG TPA: hypothetical protein VHZ53_02080 [Steroidobacteraceae bacterium]|jgi:hypothetical protein|nr:hypothetical protein [Steroidobacteraceae bacterium]